MGVSEHVPLGVTVPRAPVTLRWAHAAYFAFFVCYLAGLLLWLLLGLIPPVVFAVPALARHVHDVAGGHGALSGFASSVLMSRPDLATGWVIAAEYLFSLLNLAIGVLITLRRPKGAVARLLALACIGTAATFNEPSHVVFHLLEHAPLVTAVHFAFHIVSGIAYVWAVVLFPDGQIPLAHRIRRGWIPWTTFAVVTGLIMWVCYRSSFISHPPFFVAFFGILVPVLGIAAQTARSIDRTTSPVSRQQAGLLRAALAPALAAALLWLGAHAAESMGSTAAGTFADGVQVAFPAVFAVVPLMLFVSIVRYRLWDIDTVISRALVYTLLVGAVVVAYAAVLAVTGWLIGSDIWATAAAFVAVALVAEPLRQRCRYLANRLVFGTRLTPRETMAALAERLAATTSSDELTELTRLVVASTRATEAQIWLLSQGHLMLVAGTADGEPNQAALRALAEETIRGCAAALNGSTVYPIGHEGRLLAVLAVRLPSRVALPASERGLVEDLASHAGLLVANAKLAAELAREVATVTVRTAELIGSRQGVVAASDAARHRLERDIHDGAQQELVAVLIQLRALVALDTTAMSAQLPAVRSMLEHAREVISDLARGGRPAELASGGLPLALESVVAAGRRAGLTIDLQCSLDSRPPPDVELAVYFCCVEAVQNATKHARAQQVLVRLATRDAEVVLEVRDDGVGFDVSASTGSGLAGLRERLAAVGGTVVVESSPGAGTVTMCRAPLPQMARKEAAR